MVRADLVIKLIEHYKYGETEKVRKVIDDIILSERSKNNDAVATKIRMVYENGIRYNGVFSGDSHGQTQVERISEDSDNLLFEEIKPRKDRTDISLSTELNGMLDNIIFENSHRDQMISWGFYPSNKILLCGPPGTGKTLFSEVFASELGYSLIYVHLDSLISSLLGQTGSNLRNVFNYAMKHKVILFLDEFDAIGKIRGDSRELGELKRVVNSLIQNLDSFHCESIVLAATNHPQILDEAIWRRFDYILWFDLPDEGQRKSIISIHLKGAPTKNLDIDEITRLSGGLTGAQIAEMVRIAARSAIQAERKFICQEDILFGYNELVNGNHSKKRILYPNNNSDRIAKLEALALRKKGYTYKKIAEKLEISQTTAWNYINEGEGDGKK